MTLLNVALPPGMYKNGTPYTRKGRWTDGNLVRWEQNTVRPIGGWERRQKADNTGNIPAIIADPSSEAVRDIFSWVSNDQNPNVVFGSNLGCYHLSGNGTITNITYAGYTPNNSSKDADTPAGFGSGLFGTGPFGISTGSTGATVVPPDRWYFANFGQVLLTGVINNGDIYELDLSTLTLSSVSNAPTNVSDVCVSEQRQVIVVGGDGSPRRFQASDIEDRTNWTPAVANQVVDRVISGTGKILRCIPVLNQIILLGENDLNVARYIGPPYVFAVDLAGESCGLICPQAIAKTERFAVWWGERTFWLYDGALKELPCSVIDYLYDDLDPQQVSKITSFSNTLYNEVWWLYQSSLSASEVDSYIVWNYVNNTWYTGKLDRTAGLDSGVTNTLLMVDSAGAIFNHELDGVLPDGSIFVSSGALELGNGYHNMAVRYIYPDTAGSGGVEYELIAKQLPNDIETTHGPFSYQASDPIPTTGVLGREISLKVTLTSADAQVGNHRFDFSPMGTGRR